MSVSHANKTESTQEPQGVKTVGEAAPQFADNRASRTAQLTMQQLMHTCSRSTAQRATANALNASPVQQQKIIQRAAPEEDLQQEAIPQTAQFADMEEEGPLQGKFETAQRAEDEEPLQGKFDTVQRAEDEELLQGKFETAQRAEDEELLQGKFEPAQRAEKPNNTGLPDNLKSGIENLSGMSMDHVKVHYNSEKPAPLQAHAYAQGSEIHVAPGQEKHLPHEAWHVVQQAQGRVKPTLQLKGAVAINDDRDLEAEADQMGAKALQLHTALPLNQSNTADAKQLSPSISAAVITQLEEIDVEATGVTHLVRLNESGSLYQEDYIDNEVAETQRGDVINIETHDVLYSRRGPNQELDPTRDEEGESKHKWINALEFNKRELPKESYIRDGTFVEKPKDSSLLLSPQEQKQAEERGSLLLSYDIPTSGPVYLIDAAHRGDMYQLRAALAVKNYPVIVYNVDGENDLTNYLSNAPDVEIYKLPYNPAAPTEEDFVKGRVYRSLDVKSESDATKIIVDDPEKAENIKNSMATIPEECVEAIDEAVDTVFEGVSDNAALLMYRDSGQTNLVYPELDSGEALPTLGKMMKERGFMPVFCGAPESESTFRNIGAYWLALDGIPQLAGDKVPKNNPKKFKRDIEAEFMRIAHAKNKFRIVVGFRSGALDLFTMLGIPTISIGLKNLVGEDRHSKYVGNPDWKRTNIQYDIPRSDVTKLTKGRGDSKLYMSPYWKMRSTDKAESSEKQKFPSAANAPGNFHPADLDTIGKGLDIGIAKLSAQKGKVHNAVVTRSESALDDMPRGLTEFTLNVEDEDRKQEKIREFWERWAQMTIKTLRIRLEYKKDLEKEKSTDDIPGLLKERELAEQNKLNLYLLHRREIQKSKIESSDKVRDPIVKKEPPPKKEKQLSSNAQKVLQKLKEALPNRISLPDSKNDSAVQEKFGLSSKEFFEAYKELAKRKKVGCNQDGPFLL